MSWRLVASRSPSAPNSITTRARGDPADGCERLLERVGGVAEVDVHGGASVTRDELGAAGKVRLDAPAVERGDEPFPRVAALEDHDDREARHWRPCARPITGTTVVSSRPSGPLSRNSVPS